MLGDRGRTVVGRVGDDDAAPGRLRQVHVARVPDAEEADEPERGTLAEHLGVEGGVIEEYRLGFADALDQLRPVSRWARVELHRPDPPQPRSRRRPSLRL